MNVLVAFTVTADGEIKMQNAEIRDAVISPLHVSHSNLYDPRKEKLDDFVARQKAKEPTPDIRFMIQQKCLNTGKWINSGIAIEQIAESGEGQKRTRFCVDHFTY